MPTLVFNLLILLVLAMVCIVIDYFLKVDDVEKKLIPWQPFVQRMIWMVYGMIFVFILF